MRQLLLCSKFNDLAVSSDVQCLGAWDTTCWYKATNTAPSIAWRREARMRKSHHQSDEHWNCFKANISESSERWGGVHMSFPEHKDTILKVLWTGSMAVGEYQLPKELCSCGAKWLLLLPPPPPPHRKKKFWIPPTLCTQDRTDTPSRGPLPSIWSLSFNKMCRHLTGLRTKLQSTKK